MSSRIISKARADAAKPWHPTVLVRTPAEGQFPPVAAAAETGAVLSAGALNKASRVAVQDGVDGAVDGPHAADQSILQERVQITALAAHINELVTDFEQSLASDVLSLSLELAKLIVRQSLRVRPDLIMGVLREAVASLPGINEQTELRLHPADAQLLRQLSEQDPALAELKWKIVEDAQVERGGCRLDTPATELDATLETRWRRVIAPLGRDDAWFDITT